MERFWYKVKKSEDCWEWQAARMSSGYGMMRLNGVSTGAHRISWMLHYGDIPKGVCVCHKCDNRLCVRPDHLFLGTQADNIRDMMNKGRIARGKQLNHPNQKGDKNHNAVVTEKQVRHVLLMYYKENKKQAEISRIVGLTYANVWAIVHRKSWKHIDVESL